MAKLEGVKTIDMKDGEITKISYDGAEYERIAHDFKDARTGDIFFYNGRDEYYEITIRKTDFYGIYHPVRFTEDDGTDNGYMRSCPLHPLFRKISANDSSPTLAEVSDKVNAIEGRVSALEDEPKRIAIGEYAVVTGKGDRGVFRTHEFDIGEVVKVTRYGTVEDRVCAEYIDGSGYWWVYNGHLRKATEEEVAEAKAPKFEVGDYVKTKHPGQFFDVKADTLVKITEIDEIHWDEFYVGAELIDGSDFDYFRPQDLEKLEGKDVERIEQFAKAGRKLNEFKKGDIVSTKLYGIAEVEDVLEGYVFAIRGKFSSENTSGIRPGACTLIAPVETRVDGA